MAISKEKLVTLNKYADQLKSRLSDSVPVKHSNRIEQYRQFLKNELEGVTKKLNDAKLEGSK